MSGWKSPTVSEIQRASGAQDREGSVVEGWVPSTQRARPCSPDLWFRIEVLIPPAKTVACWRLTTEALSRITLYHKKLPCSTVCTCPVHNEY